MANDFLDDSDKLSLGATFVKKIDKNLEDITDDVSVIEKKLPQLQSIKRISDTARLYAERSSSWIDASTLPSPAVMETIHPKALVNKSATTPSMTYRSPLSCEENELHDP